MLAVIAQWADDECEVDLRGRDGVVMPSDSVKLDEPRRRERLRADCRIEPERGERGDGLLA